MSLIPFPTRELFEEQLPSFDVIVLQNFEYLPYGISDYLENIRSYVEGGGGLAMLGGAQSFTSGGYADTPVAAAQPGDNGRHYTTLWEKTINWLIQDPDLRNLHVDTDAVEYLPGASVRVNVRLLGRDYQPLPKGVVSLVIKRGADPNTAVQVAEAKLTTGDDGTATYELGGAVLEAGVYRVVGKAEIAGRQVDASDIFLVREGGKELDNPVGDKEMLHSIAEATGGTALGAIDELPANLALDPPRIVRVDRRTDVELWSRPGLLILIVGLLGLEWLLRQRSGYL
jgi:hypothetical protein